MLKKLFKPKWQNKNPSVRIKAIAKLAENSQELIQLAKNDPDNSVRVAAINKLQHIETLSALTSEQSSNISHAAQQRLADLAISHDIDDKALAMVYGLIDDKAVHQKIVKDSSKSPAIRKQALEHIDDQQLLFEIASDKQSKELQFLAAQKLTSYEHLKQLEKFTKNNKRLRQFLKEKLQQEKAKQEQLEQLNKLCNELAGLGETQHWQQAKTRFLMIQQQWKAANVDIPDDLQKRYSQAILAFEQKLADYQQQEEKLKPLKQSFNAITATLDKLHDDLKQSKNYELSQDTIREITQAAELSWQELQEKLPKDMAESMSNDYQARHKKLEKVIAEFTAKQKSFQQFQAICHKAKQLNNSKRGISQKQITTLQKQWAALKAPIDLDISELQQEYKQHINSLTIKLEKQEAAVKDKLIEINQLLDSMEADIEADQLGKAIQSYQATYKLLNNLHGIPQDQYRRIKKRLAAVTPTIKSAQSWRHWGTDKAREQLIEQAEQLRDNQEIAPLDRAKQLKKLRNDWKRLGKMDPSKHQHLWEKFDSICTQAYEPCKAYYDEEARKREQNLHKRLDICQQLETLEKETDWKNVDWKAITQKINKLRSQWKQIGSVNRNKWKMVNQAFNDAMDAIEVHLENERRINWTRRENLVKQAEALQLELEKGADLLDIIEQAKALQAQWKPTVTAKRSDERKLWAAFRAALDNIFEQQRSERQATQAELQDNLEKKQAILAELEQLLTLEGTELEQAAKKLPQLEDDFNAIQKLPKGKQVAQLEKSFSQAQTALTEKLAQQQEREKREQLLLLGKKSALCQQKRQGEDVQAEWDALPALQNQTLEQQIQKQFSSEVSDTQAYAENEKKLQQLTLEIETLLEIPSPEAYQQERMEYQVSRLSKQMLGTMTEQENLEQAYKKIQQCYLICDISPEFTKQQQSRFQAIEAWLRKL